RKLSPSKIVISPGPCTPEEAGNSKQVIKTFHQEIPILAVCLGHQCLGSVFGGNVVRAPKFMHGKASQISHEDEGIFKGLAKPFTATRYHSLIVEESTLPEVLNITARSEDGMIMGLKHRDFPCFGVQFHPESILTTEGKNLLKN